MTTEERTMIASSQRVERHLRDLGDLYHEFGDTLRGEASLLGRMRVKGQALRKALSNRTVEEFALIYSGFLVRAPDSKTKGPFAVKKAERKPEAASGPEAS